MDHTLDRPGTAANGVQIRKARGNREVRPGAGERKAKQIHNRIRTRRRLRAIRTISEGLAIFGCIWTAGIIEATDLAEISLSGSGSQLIISVSMAIAAVAMDLLMLLIEKRIKK